MKRSWMLAAGSAVLISITGSPAGAVAVQNDVVSSSASAADVVSSSESYVEPPPEADADLEAMLESSPASESATTPGGAMTQPLTQPAEDAPEGITATASTCAAEAEQLARGDISTYQCVEVVDSGTALSSTADESTALPSACSANNGSGTGWLAPDRRTACNHEIFGLESLNTPRTDHHGKPVPPTCTRPAR